MVFMISIYTITSCDNNRKKNLEETLKSIIENQIGNNGTIFETSNFQIRGNISNIADNDELVLGYFGA